MSDAIALLGCVGTVWLAVLSLRWGWDRPKTVHLYRRTHPTTLDLQTIGMVNVKDLCGWSDMKLQQLKWTRLIDDQYEIKAAWYGPVPPMKFKRSKP